MHGTPSAPDAATLKKGPGRAEFVFLMAALMASNALAIDAMLPALPAIGAGLAVADENSRQLVITSYLLGFGVAQIGYGPLADRFGRKRLMIGAMAFYALFALLAGIAGSFTLLLAARAAQGVAAAATRVLVVAVVRDRFEGSAMAQIMSTVMIVFMIVPVLAPTLGQAVLAVAEWRYIFLALAGYGAMLAVWTWLRLAETLRPEHRRALSFHTIGQAMGETLRNRQSIGNTVSQTLVMGGLFGFINSIQQIVFDVFDRPELIGLVFACIAGPMALSSYANSRLVMRYGSRKLLLIALTAFNCVAALHLGVAWYAGESLWTFVILQAATMIFFGLIGANSGALAMAPLGHVAGTASALQGVIGTLGGALVGLAIGQAFDGTTLPFLIGLVLTAMLALLTAIWANRPPAERAEPVDVEVQETVSRPA